MKPACRNFGAPDPARRGLAANSAPVEVLLVDIEADLVIVDDGRTVWNEEGFAVPDRDRTVLTVDPVGRAGVPIVGVMVRRVLDLRGGVGG